MRDIKKVYAWQFWRQQRLPWSKPSTDSGLKQLRKTTSSLEQLGRDSGLKQLRK